MDNHLFFSLNSDFDLAKKIVSNLGDELSPINITQFADGELFCQPLVSVRNKKVFIIHTLSKPVNENIMKLLISIDAFKRSAPQEINVIIPYFAYSRQDRKTEGRTPISAKLVSDIISTAGANRLLLVELHSDQIQGFFNIPIDHLLTIYCIANYLKKNLDLKNTVIVAPDFGATKKARKLSELLGIPLSIIEKKREQANQAESLYVFGLIKDQNCIIIDDIIDTGGTIMSASSLLKQQGAKNIYIAATHGLFNNNAIAKFQESNNAGIIKQIFVTNTVNNEETDFLKIIDISTFLSQILQIYINNKGSVTSLYASYSKKIADTNPA